ncbi:MAG: hypothetical protein PHG67_00885 [Bacteroidales bacterium]|nr:hypothetical protein [Bacteroidales bacterium]
MRFLMSVCRSGKLLFLVLLIGFIQCSSPQKLIDQKQYDQAFALLINKAHKGRISASQITQLKQVYHQSNQTDHEAVSALKASGSPDIWPEVYDRLNKISQRVDAVKVLPKELKQQLDYKPLDLEEEVLAARIKTTQYYNGLAVKLLESNDAASNSEALDLLGKVQQLNPAFPDLDKKMRRAVFSMADNILIGFKNETGVSLPAGFEEKVLDKTTFAESSWQQKLIRTPEQAVGITYRMIVILEEIEVSPHKSGQTSYTEQKEAVTAEVVQYELQKSVSLTGRIQLVGTDYSKPFLVSPFDVSSQFDYTYARFSGSEQALALATLELTKKAALPFPSDESLIRDAATELNKIVALLLK